MNKLTAMVSLPRRRARLEAPFMAIDATAFSTGQLAAWSAKLARYSVLPTPTRGVYRAALCAGKSATGHHRAHQQPHPRMVMRHR